MNGSTIGVLTIQDKPTNAFRTASSSGTVYQGKAS
jgi:hypothetical protein